MPQEDGQVNCGIPKILSRENEENHVEINVEKHVLNERKKTAEC